MCYLYDKSLSNNIYFCYIYLEDDIFRSNVRNLQSDLTGTVLLFETVTFVLQPRYSPISLLAFLHLIWSSSYSNLIFCVYISVEVTLWIVTDGLTHCSLYSLYLVSLLFHSILTTSTSFLSWYFCSWISFLSFSLFFSVFLWLCSLSLAIAISVRCLY